MIFVTCKQEEKSLVLLTTAILFSESDWKNTHKEAEHGLGLLQILLPLMSIKQNILHFL